MASLSAISVPQNTYPFSLVGSRVNNNNNNINNNNIKPLPKTLRPKTPIESCLINNEIGDVKVNDLRPYVKVDESKTPFVNEKGQLIVPGISLELPNYEQKYKNKYDELSNQILKFRDDNNNIIRTALDNTNRRYTYALVVAAIFIIIFLIGWSIYLAIRTNE